MCFKNPENDCMSDFGKNGVTRNVYKAVYQAVTFKKRSMTAQPVTMTARKACCHGNTI